MPDSKSLERLVPDEIVGDEHTGDETLELHLARYRFAAAMARPGRLLDCACGVGYGTRLVTEAVGAIDEGLGVDIDPQAVEYAERRYADARTRYVQRDVLVDELSGLGRFDTVVSLETIEHLTDPRAFLTRLVPLLAPEGVLVASVPVTPSVDLNPHHLHDFTDRSFRALLSSVGLAVFDELVQVQHVDPLAVARRTEKRMEGMRTGLLAWYARHPGALLRRVGATLRHGLTNKYLTVACRRIDGAGEQRR